MPNAWSAVVGMWLDDVQPVTRLRRRWLSGPDPQRDRCSDVDQLAEELEQSQALLAAINDEEPTKKAG